MLCENIIYELTASAAVWADLDWRAPKLISDQSGKPFPDWFRTPYWLSITMNHSRTLNSWEAFWGKKQRERGLFGGYFVKKESLLFCSHPLLLVNLYDSSFNAQIYIYIFIFFHASHVWSSLTLWRNVHASAINKVMQHFTTAFGFTSQVTYSCSHSNICRSIDRSSRKNSFPGGSHSCSDRILELGNREILSHRMVFPSLEMFMS